MLLIPSGPDAFRPRERRISAIRPCAAALALAALAASPAPAQVVPGLPGEGIEPPAFPELEREGQDEATTETVRSTTVTIATTVATQVNTVLAPVPAAVIAPEDSAAAGRRRIGRDGEGGFSMDGTVAGWVSGSATRVINDFAPTEFDGEVYKPLIGADYSSDRGWVAGLSFGYERSDIDTDFNDGTLKSDGLIVAPYFGVRVLDNVVLDAGGGYVWLDYDRTRDFGAARGSFDADRYFLFTSATGYVPQEWTGFRETVLAGRLGFRYSNEDQDGFVEGGVPVPGGTVELGQVVLGGEVRYYPDVSDTGLWGLQLFARAEGNIDVIRTERDPLAGFAQTSDDRTDVTLALGATASFTDRITGDLSVENMFSRKDITQATVNVGLRIEF